jgi:uncharacterized membrane-anchored protein
VGQRHARVPRRPHGKVEDRAGSLGAVREHETALRVPRVTVYFWIIKALSTAMGEAASDYLVHVFPPVLAVVLGFVGFLIAMAIQLTRRRYVAWAYWLAVCAVGVFGTMVADVLHVGFGVPYAVSAPLFAIILAAVFILWFRVERTLSIHTVDSTRREIFYWLAVVSTFALGTAVGDLTAVTFSLGYLISAIVFGALIVAVALAYRLVRLGPVIAFWSAYVLTRPFGASVADWLGKPPALGGIGVGDGTVALVFLLAIIALVTYLQVSKRDVQTARSHSASRES